MFNIEGSLFFVMPMEMGIQGITRYRLLFIKKVFYDKKGFMGWVDFLFQGNDIEENLELYIKDSSKCIVRCSIRMTKKEHRRIRRSRPESSS